MLTTVEFVLYARGNSGAIAFLNQLTDDPKSQTILSFLRKAPTVRGTNLWVLYSDLADKDMDIVYNLCLNAPSDLLADACSHQDYSGKKSIEQYISCGAPSDLD